MKVKKQFIARSLRAFLCSVVFPAVGIAFIVICTVCHVGCKSSVDGVTFLQGDFSVPQLKGFEIQGNNKLYLKFDRKISVSYVSVLQEDNSTFDGSISVLYDVDKFGAEFLLSKETQIGESYIFESQIKDGAGNSVALSIPFYGYNDNVPRLIISEVRNYYGDSSEKGQKTKRCEFIELVALDDGNLSGVQMVNAGDGESKKYSFPSVFVHKGEYITLHLRTPELEDYQGAQNENEDLTLSTAPDSCKTALDLWIDSAKARLAEDEVILLRDVNHKSIIDCLLYCQKAEESTWPSQYERLLQEAMESGIWTDTDGNINVSFEAAADGRGMRSAIHSLSRQNVSSILERANNDRNYIPKNDCSQWIVTARRLATSKKTGDPGVTPGYANSSNLYVKK